MTRLLIFGIAFGLVVALQCSFFGRLVFLFRLPQTEAYFVFSIRLLFYQLGASHVLSIFFQRTPLFLIVLYDFVLLGTYPLALPDAIPENKVGAVTIKR